MTLLMLLRSSSPSTASSAYVSLPLSVDASPSHAAQNGLATKVQTSRKQRKERKNRAKKLKGVKKVLHLCWLSFLPSSNSRVRPRVPMLPARRARSKLLLVLSHNQLLSFNRTMRLH